MSEHIAIVEWKIDGSKFLDRSPNRIAKPTNLG